MLSISCLGAFPSLNNQISVLSIKKKIWLFQCYFDCMSEFDTYFVVSCYRSEYILWNVCVLLIRVSGKFPCSYLVIKIQTEHWFFGYPVSGFMFCSVYYPYLKENFRFKCGIVLWFCSHAHAENSLSYVIFNEHFFFLQ